MLFGGTEASNCVDINTHY